MDTGRSDDLVNEALATGSPPGGVTPDERAEIERVLEARVALRSAADVARREAAIAQPSARVRFGRFLEAEQAPGSRETRGVGAVQEPGRSRRRFPFPRPALAVPALAAAAVVLGLLLVVRQTFGTVETAVALESGDYVQLEGIIQDVKPDGEHLLLAVRSAAGGFTAVVAHDTTVAPGPGRDGLVRGATVSVDGVALARRRVDASTVVVSAHRAPAGAGIARPGAGAGEVAGTVALVRLDRDGGSGEVVVLTDEGRRLIVTVDGQSLESLLLRFSTALGERVRAVPVADRPGVFRLVARDAAPDAAPTPEGGRPVLVTERGVITRIGSVGLVLRGTGGLREVVFRERTRFFGGASGLDRDQLRDGRSALGHAVSVTGRVDPATGAFVADVVIVGRELPPPTR